MVVYALTNRKLLRRGNVMDNYDLSNLPLLGHCADSGEHHPQLTDEENRRATFSGRSTTVTTSEQAERQQLPPTGDALLSEQRALADFDISLASNVSTPLIVDEPVVDEPEDPFAALAAYRSLVFDDDSQHPSNRELGLGFGLLKGFMAEDLTDLAAEDLTDIVLAEPEENDVLEPLVQPKRPEQPEQSQGESEKGVVVPESANPDTVPGKRSRKRRASQPRDVVIGDIPEFVIKKSLCRSRRLSKKRQKLESTDTEFLPLPRGTATASQSAAMPEKSADSQKNQGLKPDNSLKERVKNETAKWVVRLERGVKRRYLCSYPNCGSTYKTLSNVRTHIFAHTGISIYKCPYPECGDKPYFRDNYDLQRHVQSHHTHDRPYFCPLCNRRYGRLDNYKVHMLQMHKTAI